MNDPTPAKVRTLDIEGQPVRCIETTRKASAATRQSPSGAASRMDRSRSGCQHQWSG
jgi:hypothetical protein